MVEKQFQTNVLQKMATVSEDLIVIGSWFQIVGAVTKKACVPILSLVLATKSCFETVDLRVHNSAHLKHTLVPLVRVTLIKQAP